MASTSGIYHVGTQDEVSISDLAERIGRCLAATDRGQCPGELQRGSTLRRCPDIRKVSALGYRPRVSLDDGLAKTVDWYARRRSAQAPSGSGTFQYPEVSM